MTMTTPPASTTIIRNVRPLGYDTVDVRIEDGLITAIQPAITVAEGAEVIEGENRLLFQGFVDAHTHMDKTLMGLPWHRHTAGPTLLDKIEGERRLRREEGIDSHVQSSRHADRAILAGTTHIRSFSDIDTEWKLDGFHGLMQTKEDYAGRVDIQVVAFPQSGMLVRPGTVELMDQALADGADLVGGLDPCTIDRDPKGHLDAIFALAEKYDVDVDMHLHESGELGAFDLELIAERAKTLGWQGRVTISHAFCLGTVEPARLTSLIDRLLENDIAIMSTGPGSSMAPPIAQLREAGVRVCTGNDGIQDAWGPLNVPEMLLRTYLLCYRNNFRRDDEIEVAIDIATNGGAEVMGIADYGFAPGMSADLAIIDHETHVSAVVNQPKPWLVMKHGRVTARDGALV
jgi:cytosine/adenosine deaminase-related metal-dependent hydrolase